MPVTWPLFLMRVSSVPVAPATSTLVNAPAEYRNPCWTLAASVYTPAISLLSLIPIAVVLVAVGKSNEVKVRPPEEKPVRLGSGIGPDTRDDSG
jgi:hypothetical protein